MSLIELEAVLFKELASLLGLNYTVSGQVNIVPPCETVLKVPGGLAVSYEDDFVDGFMSQHLQTFFVYVIFCFKLLNVTSQRA